MILSNYIALMSDIVRLSEWGISYDAGLTLIELGFVGGVGQRGQSEGSGMEPLIDNPTMGE